MGLNFLDSIGHFSHFPIQVIVGVCGQTKVPERQNGNGNGEGVSKVTMDIGAVKRQEDQKNVDVHAIVDPGSTQFDMPRHLKKELG